MRDLICLLLLAGSAAGVQAQNIKGHYVVMHEADGAIYHTLPKTLFESKEHGELTFDITYKERQQGIAVFNFTYAMPLFTPADSIRIYSDSRVLMSGSVQKIYAEPERKGWAHRYTFSVPVAQLDAFFDKEALPEVTVYSKGQAYVYPAKRSAWRSYAPVGARIFEMIRVNERE